VTAKPAIPDPLDDCTCRRADRNGAWHATIVGKSLNPIRLVHVLRKQLRDGIFDREHSNRGLEAPDPISLSPPCGGHHRFTQWPTHPKPLRDCFRIHLDQLGA
jgi:hypothetical protein